MRTNYACIIVLGTLLSISCGSQGSPQWDHFVFSNQWPETVCMESKHMHTHDCEIPANVTQFTIHGLWPNEGPTPGPCFCNETAKFDFNQIKGILGQLLKYWPNLYAESKLEEFWAHEWTKHGTCCMDHPDLNTELKYFQKGLDLGNQFNILQILKSNGVQPADDKTYPELAIGIPFIANAINGIPIEIELIFDRYTEVYNALKKALVTPSLFCYYVKETRTQYLSEIHFCINKKTFGVMPCPTKSFGGPKPCSSPRSFEKGLSRPGISLLSAQSDKNRIISMNNQKFSQLNGFVGSTTPCHSNQHIALPIIHPTKK